MKYTAGWMVDFIIREFKNANIKLEIFCNIFIFDCENNKRMPLI